MLKKILIIFFSIIVIPITGLSQIDYNQYIQDFKSQTDPQKQYEIMKNIKQINNTNFNNFYIEVLKGNYKYNIKRIAILGLDENLMGPNSEIANKIVNILKKETNEILIEEEINLLGKIGSGELTGILIPYLASEKINIREASVKALYHIGTKECVEPVRKLLKKERGDSYSSHTIRKFCMLILAKYRDKSSVPEVEKIVYNTVTNTNINDESIYALKTIKSVDEEKAREVVSKVIEKLENEEVKKTLLEEVKAPVVVPETPVVEEREKKIKEVIEESETEIELDSKIETADKIPERFSKKEEALEYIGTLMSLADELSEKLKRGELKERYFMKLGNIYLKLGDIYKNLKDNENAKMYYKKAKNAFKKNIE